MEAIRDRAREEANQRAERLRSLNTEIEALRHSETDQLERIREAEFRLKEQQRSTERAQSKALELVAASSPEPEILSDSEAADEPWLQIDLDHKAKASAPVPRENEIVKAETSADLALFEPADFGGGSSPEQSAPGLEPLDDEPSFLSGVADQLSSKNSAQRAAALADLAHRGGDESFRLITKSFEDPAVEVRNATARALYDLELDRAASFTRALREASPDRRRKIGAAIAGSGLAGDAINALAGDSRERTHDAFSILFLMAKAGEVQPLMQAIKEHSDLDVRLAVAKVLALANQPQCLPGLRNLVMRGSLPTAVHAAVMEAIYSLSNEAREGVPVGV
jgi:hypothetical protein